MNLAELEVYKVTPTLSKMFTISYILRRSTPTRKFNTKKLSFCSKFVLGRRHLYDSVRNSILSRADNNENENWYIGSYPIEEQQHPIRRSPHLRDCTTSKNCTKPKFILNQEQRRCFYSYKNCMCASISETDDKIVNYLVHKRPRDFSFRL